MSQPALEQEFFLFACLALCTVQTQRRIMLTADGYPVVSRLSINDLAAAAIKVIQMCQSVPPTLYA